WGGEEGRIERGDASYDAQRLAQRVVEGARADRDGGALYLGDQSGEILHVVGADFDVVEHRLQRVAGVERVEIGELFRVLAQDRRRITNRFRALLRRRVAPQQERLSRCTDRPIDVLRASVERSAQRFTGRRAGDCNFAPAGGCVPDAAVVEAAPPRKTRGQRALGKLEHATSRQAFAPTFRSSDEETAREYSGATRTSITQSAPPRTSATPRSIAAESSSRVRTAPKPSAPWPRASSARSIAGSLMRMPIQRFSIRRPRMRATRSWC